MRLNRIRLIGFHFFFLLITAVSFRHLFIEGDHLWTGEGARLSWSMRLKGKVCDFLVKKGEGKWMRPDFSGLSFIQHVSLDDPYFFLQYVKSTLCNPGERVFASVTCRAVSREPVR